MSQLPIKAVIVDDEPNGQIVLNELLRKHCPVVQVVGKASNIQEAFTVITAEKPHIVFLDIQMPNGNGFDLLRMFEEIFFKVVFVTSHHQYAINAIKFNALDYLLKPVDVNELKQAVERAKQNIKQNGLSNFIEFIDDSKQEIKLPIHQNHEVLLVPQSVMVTITGDDNYSEVLTTSNEKYVLSKTLKEIELYFSHSNKFIRVRRELLINADHIVSYSKTEPCIIKLSNNISIEVSRRKRQEVLEVLRQIRG